MSYICLKYISFLSLQNFVDFQSCGGLVLLLPGPEIGFVGHNLFWVVWMLYVVSDTQVKVGGFLLICRELCVLCLKLWTI